MGLAPFPGHSREACPREGGERRSMGLSITADERMASEGE